MTPLSPPGEEPAGPIDADSRLLTLERRLDAIEQGEPRTIPQVYDKLQTFERNVAKCIKEMEHRQILRDSKERVEAKDSSQKLQAQLHFVTLELKSTKDHVDTLKESLVSARAAVEEHKRTAENMGKQLAAERDQNKTMMAELSQTKKELDDARRRLQAQARL